ncbi:MAG TPA: AraC family transcriptional regulator [Usitatibacter sp.]|jgi:AraC family transcriptional regulator|nr:AraC family transcriptional regulator [Usitatibacter sp.]
MNPLAAAPPKPLRQALPPPIATTRGRGWACAPVDVYRIGDLAFGGTHREHLVSVQLAGVSCLSHEREGMACEEEVGPGDVIVAPAGSSTTWRQRGDATVLVAWIPQSQLASVLERATGRGTAMPRPRHALPAGDLRIAEIARALWQELSAERIGARLYVESAVEQLALQLVREHCDIEDPRTAPITISPHKLRLAKAYIQENLSADLSVESIARATGMSAFHFAHAFRAATGVPPHRYVVQRRIDRAKVLLQNPRLSLTDIAQRVGYSSASHFSVSFRKMAHLAPSEFRKRT